MIKVVGVGDIMPGGLLNGSNEPCVDKDLLDVLLQGDVRCGTLECALGNEPKYDKAKVADRGNVIYAKDDDVRRLKELNIDIVSLANNHFFDLGAEGAQHTIELLDKEGVLHCGAGRNLQEAGQPVVIEKAGKKVAFLAFCDVDYDNVYMCTYATEDTPGVNPMQEDYFISEIKKNKEKYDYVVVLAHWGTENTFYPNVSTVKMANQMMDAGACLVLGSHPHRVQPVMNTPKGSVAFSMGNFLFPERLIAPPKVTYYPKEPLDYSTLPVTMKYPLVSRVTLKTLPFHARVGLIVTSVISDKDVTSSYTFSYLNKDNGLELLEEGKSGILKKTIEKIGGSINRKSYPIYPGMVKLKNSSLKLAKAVLVKAKKLGKSKKRSTHK